MIAIDLFCGAGGLTRGLMNAGIDVLVGIDINSDCRLTYERNNRPAQFFCADLRDVARTTLAPFLKGRRKEPLLLAGCAPCQPFSAHRRSSKADDERRLLREVSRLAAELKPEFVLIENVPGLAKVKGFSTYSRFQRALVALGYDFTCSVLDAKRFGVPQTRRRLVLLAARDRLVSLPMPTHGSEEQPYETVRDAIGSYPRLQAGQRHPSIPNHYAACLTSVNLERLKRTPPDGGGRLDWPGHLTLQCHRKRKKGHEDVYGRMKWDAPAPTLTCRCFSISNGRYGHPEQHRAISLREAASIQSFPSTYVFYGPTQRSLGEQIGNAVPVCLAEVMGRHVVDLHEHGRVQGEERKRR